MGKIILESKKLSKAYSNGANKLDVIKNLNLKVKTAEIITIVGQSGAGKTTLLNLIGGLDRPDSGELIILGKNILKMNNNDAADFRNNDLGFIFQFHHLLPEFTAYENVLMPTLINDNENENLANELFDYVNLSDRKNHFPAELSGGERLRVAVLRALINQPALVLADEPTGNLDKDNTDKVVNLLIETCKRNNTSLLMVTHDIDLLNKFEKVYSLESGNLV